MLASVVRYGGSSEIIRKVISAKKKYKILRWTFLWRSIRHLLVFCQYFYSIANFLFLFTHSVIMRTNSSTILNPFYEWKSKNNDDENIWMNCRAKNNPLNYYGADWNYVDDGNEVYIVCCHKATLLVSVGFSKVWTEQENICVAQQQGQHQWPGLRAPPNNASTT